jgi:hypothetical protein
MENFINYSKLTDFNTAAIKQETQLIPPGTIAKAIMNIRSGGYEHDSHLTKSSHSGSIYLHVEFVILEGVFSRRKIFQNIGIVGFSKVGDPDVYGAQGRSLLRGLIESAKNIMPCDDSEEAQKARKINSFSELNGLVAIVKIGVEKDKSGKFDDRNMIIAAVTPDKKEYEAFILNHVSA